ncbi:MAG: hypothetical protein K0Q94_2000 [Paenibacillus sp.]|jgi:hypothetical protein|nr:hypothetical protein [Paenibacillus sp.]
MPGFIYFRVPVESESAGVLFHYITIDTPLGREFEFMQKRTGTSSHGRLCLLYPIICILGWPILLSSRFARPPH